MDLDVPYVVISAVSRVSLTQIGYYVISTLIVKM
jgi:hypothetical protein